MSSKRIVYIDNIKVLLTCLVVAHHAAQAYGPTGGMWVVSDPFRADWLRHFFFVNASFMMGLYFFISGYFMVLSMKRKSKQVFLNDRLKRLGIPLLFFTLFVFLPFNYILSGSKQNLFSFLAESYLFRAPEATGHLWFVASLLAYSIIYIIFFHWQFIKLASKAGSLATGYIFLFVILVAVLCAVVRLKYPIDAWRTWLIPVEPAHLPQYFLLFLAGAFFKHANWLEELKTRQGIFFFTLAVVGVVIHGKLPEEVRNYWLTAPVVETMMCIGISLGLLLLFRNYVNRTNEFVSKLSSNAYGIYLVHLFIVILLQNIMMDFSLNANVKFIIVAIGGILLSFLLSALIRRNKLVRQII
jgi:peptidoglycan/LPS O-acetylase OafA/YrhL